MKVESIPIEKIRTNPDRIRKELENRVRKLEYLARSIKKNGLLNPITVKEVAGNYQIIKGERRYEACIYIKAPVIDCIISETENSQMDYLRGTISRKDLTEVEKAAALVRIRTEYGFNNVTLAKDLGISESYVRKLIDIHHLPENVREDIANKKITAHAAFKNSRKKLNLLKDNKKQLTEITIPINTLKQLKLTKEQQTTLFTDISDKAWVDELKQIFLN